MDLALSRADCQPAPLRSAQPLDHEVEATASMRGRLGGQIQQEPAPGQPNAAATYNSTVYVWNPFAGTGDATPIPLPPGFRL